MCMHAQSSGLHHVPRCGLLPVHYPNRLPALAPPLRQDWNYVRAGCFEVTLELWDVKMGAPLQTLFNHNLDSMLAYATTTTFGGWAGGGAAAVSGVSRLQGGWQPGG
mgnify:CR=1 FL=1